MASDIAGILVTEAMGCELRKPARVYEQGVNRDKVHLHLLREQEYVLLAMLLRGGDFSEVEEKIGGRDSREGRQIRKSDADPDLELWGMHSCVKQKWHKHPTKTGAVKEHTKKISAAESR